MSTHNIRLFSDLFGTFLALLFVVMYSRNAKKNVSGKPPSEQAQHDNGQRLLHAMIQSQERERLRISKELHDNIGSSLSHLRYMTALIPKAASNQQALNELAEKYRTHIDLIIQDVRNISHGLSPAGLEIWGFHEALEDFCDTLRLSSGISIYIKDDSSNALDKLPFEDALSLFRVMQELISNTIKHASAEKIAITTSLEDNSIRIQYSDDGVGCDTDVFDSKGIGMYNIKNRLRLLDATCDCVTSSGTGFFSLSEYPSAA